MNTHYQFNDIELEKQFENCTLDPSLLSHEAHIRLAWIHIRKYGIDKAAQNIIRQIEKFANTVGAPEKFNKTVTIAAMKAVYHFMQVSEYTNYLDFISAFPRLKYDFKELLGLHYSIDIYNMPVAKTEFIEPDLLPFE